MFLSVTIGQIVNTQLEDDFIRFIIGFDVKNLNKRSGWLLPILDDFLLQTVFGGGIKSAGANDGLRKSEVEDKVAKNFVEKTRTFSAAFDFKKLNVFNKKDKLKNLDSPIKRLD